MALAGGVTIETAAPPRLSYFRRAKSSHPMGIAVPSIIVRRDGLRQRSRCCRAAPPVDALADGDTIHAVIKATAINNDGGTRPDTLRRA